VAVLILPVDIADSPVADELPFSLHVNQPVIRPSDADLDQIAGLLAAGNNITIYAGAGCTGAHDEVAQLAGLLEAPVAHTSRSKDQLAYDNPHIVGMTGVIGMEAGYRAILDCDTLLLLGTDFAWAQFYPKNATIIPGDPLNPNPRSVVGLSQDDMYMYLVAIDGRQAGYSNGVTQAEEADLMHVLGAYNAINFDGGGSTALVVQGANGSPDVLNRPSGGAERYDGNNLGVYALPLAPVPLPPALALFGSGLLGVFGFGRRRVTT
jgi:xanthosine utilization system XapX-like protein